MRYIQLYPDYKKVEDLREKRKKKELPYNKIMYKAASKLSETTSNKTAGLHTNRFYGENNVMANIVSHEFNNGVGVITFDKNIVTIQAYAFYQAPITEAEIPNSVTTFTTESSCGVFYECRQLETVKLSKNLTAIEDYAFCNSGLTFINIPNSVTSINSSAFNNCSKLETINIPESVTNIGSGAFQNCSKLETVNIPNNITSIGGQAFNNCSNLTSITFLGGGNSVTVGSKCFQNCSKLSKVIVKDINKWAKYEFADSAANPIAFTRSLYSDENTLITNLVISDCSYIGSYTFYYCYSIISVTLEGNITNIHQNAFQYCNNLQNLTINTNNNLNISTSNFQYVNNLILNTNISVSSYSFGNILNIYIKNIDTIKNSSFSSTISSGVGYDLYLNNQLVTELQLSEGYVEYGAFRGCKSIISVYMTDIEEIKSFAFDSCKNLESVVSITNNNYDLYINYRAFSYCNKLALLDFNNHIIEIANNIVYYSSLNNTLVIKLRNSNPPTLASDYYSSFQTCEKSDGGDFYYDFAVVKVPVEYLDAYKTKFNDNRIETI